MMDNHKPQDPAGLEKFLEFEEDQGLLWISTNDEGDRVEHLE